MSELCVFVDRTELSAEWTDDSPETRRAIERSLPLEGDATRWGEELYFRTEIDVPAEAPRTAVEPGTLAYWPQGNAVCLFWGPTPASTGDEPRAASPVNVFARVDASAFDPGSGAATLRLEAEK